MKPYTPVVARNLALSLLMTAALLFAQPGTIATVAGNGTAAFSGDGGPAVSAALSFPYGVAADSAGNVYIADSDNNRIRKVSPTGIIITVAGNGTRGFSGDGGPATSAALWGPNGVAVDSVGNLFIADSGNYRIRKVNSAGVISTVAGTGISGFSGDGGSATSATLRTPYGVFVDGSGNVYFADSENHRIRKISTAGIVTTVAGDGTSGFTVDGGPATGTALSFPPDMCVDSAGNVYIADAGHNRIRKVGPVGTISSVAGNGTQGFSGDGGPATSAALNNPIGVFVDASNNLYVADANNNRVRKVTPAGIITTVAGNGTAGFVGDGGPATSAALSFIHRVTVDGAGNLLIADARNNRIRKVASPTLAPVVNSMGVVNAASFAPLTEVAPGSIVSVFGMNLGASDGNVASSLPLPTVLAELKVTIGGREAPLFYVGKGQANAQVPVEAVAGSPAEVIARRVPSSGPEVASAPERIVIGLVGPGIFITSGTQGAILNVANQLVDSSRPAAAGDVIVIFCTGLGATSPPMQTGQPARSGVAVLQPIVTVGGVVAVVQYAGVAPGFVGLNQVNAVVPLGVAAGNSVPVAVRQEGAVSNAAMIAVR